MCMQHKTTPKTYTSLEKFSCSAFFLKMPNYESKLLFNIVTLYCDMLLCSPHNPKLYLPSFPSLHRVSTATRLIISYPWALFLSICLTTPPYFRPEANSPQVDVFPELCVRDFPAAPAELPLEPGQGNSGLVQIPVPWPGKDPLESRNKTTR